MPLAAPSGGIRLFFSSYEGRRVRRGITSNPVTVPTPQERAGDFSAGAAFFGVLNSATVAQALINRSGCAAAVQARRGVPIAADSRYAAIFPGNIIPPECFDPTAVDLLNQFVPRGELGNPYVPFCTRRTSPPRPVDIPPGPQPHQSAATQSLLIRRRQL